MSVFYLMEKEIPEDMLYPYKSVRELVKVCPMVIYSFVPKGLQPSEVLEYNFIAYYLTMKNLVPTSAYNTVEEYVSASFCALYSGDPSYPAQSIELLRRLYNQDFTANHLANLLRIQLYSPVLAAEIYPNESICKRALDELTTEELSMITATMWSNLTILNFDKYKQAIKDNLVVKIPTGEITVTENSSNIFITESYIQFMDLNQMKQFEPVKDIKLSNFGIYLTGNTNKYSIHIMIIDNVVNILYLSGLVDISICKSNNFVINHCMPNMQKDSYITYRDSVIQLMDNPVSICYPMHYVNCDVYLKDPDLFMGTKENSNLYQQETDINTICNLVPNKFKESLHMSNNELIKHIISNIPESKINAYL